MKFSILFRKFKTFMRLMREKYVSARGWVEPYTLHGLVKRWRVAHYPKAKPTIIATYITFYGDEFIEASIASIYPFVEKIVFFHSNISWDGRIGNTVKPAVQAWKQVYDTENKIIEVDFDSDNQQVQRQYTFDYLNEHFTYDFMMIIDSDEVWSDKAFERAIYHLKGEPKVNLFFPRMHFYMKSPYYQVINTTAHLPAFLRTGFSPAIGVRATLVKPRYDMQNVVVEHYNLVHYTDELSFQKNRTSHYAERTSLGLTEEEYRIDFEAWERKVWEAIPNTKDLFIRKGYEKTFKGMRQITYNDLPEAVKKYSGKIISLFDPKTGKRI